MSTTFATVALATSDDAPTVGTALGLAFVDDPVFEWLLPDRARRSERLPSVFAAFTELYLPYRETYVAANGAGAALWAPPGADPFTGEAVETFAQRMDAVLGQDAGRAWEINDLLEQHHPSQPCFYLQFMGVRPEHQRQGTGSRLLATVLRRCDEAGTPAYLEATSADNRRLYQRHGFDVVDEVTLSEGPPLWPMWRPAREAA